MCHLLPPAGSREKCMSCDQLYKMTMLKEYLKCTVRNFKYKYLFCCLTCMLWHFCVQVLLSSLLSYSDAMGTGVARWSSGCHGTISSRVFRDGPGIGQVVQNSFIIWFEINLAQSLLCHLHNKGRLMFLSRCGWPWQPSRSEDTLYSVCFCI